MGLPRPLSRFLVDHPPLARAASRATQTFSLARVRTVGMPETSTCEDVLRSATKRRMVAKAVYEELVGMQESEIKIEGRSSMRRVEDRFPGGRADVEQLVKEAASEPGARSPYSVTLRRVREELEK
jgi:hypothetical protein